MRKFPQLSFIAVASNRHLLPAGLEIIIEAMLAAVLLGSAYNGARANATAAEWFLAVTAVAK
jgi:hypothetical protein